MILGIQTELQKSGWLTATHTQESFTVSRPVMRKENTCGDLLSLLATIKQVKNIKLKSENQEQLRILHVFRFFSMMKILKLSERESTSVSNVNVMWKLNSALLA